MLLLLLTLMKASPEGKIRVEIVFCFVFSTCDGETRGEVGEGFFFFFFFAVVVDRVGRG